MSIAILARKTRTLNGNRYARGFTLYTSKSGQCAPCGGGAPAQQKSFRQLQADKKRGGGPRPDGINGSSCCLNTWKPVVDSKGNQSIGVFLMKKKTNVIKCDASNNTTNNCENNGCGCKCSRRVGESRCCNVHKDTGPKTNSEYIPIAISKRACFTGDLQTCPQCIEAKPIGNSCLRK